jgi:hypothetical protein
MKTKISDWYWAGLYDIVELKERLIKLGQDNGENYEMLKSRAFELVEDELVRALSEHGPMKSSHEGWALIREEVDEMWEEVKANRKVEAREECKQVAAMALRYLMEVH